MDINFSVHIIPGIYDSYLVKSCGRSIGHIKPGDINKFMIDGDPSVLKPFSNWRSTFSCGLKQKLGLS